MKIENQVNSYQQGLRLHELGVVKNESYFQWMECLLPTGDNSTTTEWWAIFRPNIGEFDFMTDMEIPEGYDNVEDYDTNRECSAFTAGELGCMLPDGDSIGSAQIETFRATKGFDRYVCKAEGVEYDNNDPIFRTEGKTEAEARANMLIHLLENKLTTPEEVNKRLTES
jgi:hypothetical protein